jgi:hypothetical protein
MRTIPLIFSPSNAAKPHRAATRDISSQKYLAQSSQYAKICCAHHKPQKNPRGLRDAQRMGRIVERVVSNRKGGTVGQFSGRPADSKQCRSRGNLREL